MPDVFANITKVPDEMVAMVADVLETRAAIPSQQEMIKSYLSEIKFPENAKVLEVGCGTGPVCRALVAIPNVASVTGIDPSSILIEKAKGLSENIGNITYLEGDGKALQFDDASFDAVILHTILTHVPDPQKILSEASRMLKTGGLLGVCDGDFATATLSSSDLDPLEICCKSFVENYVTDKYMVRKMSSLVAEAGFSVNPMRSYGLVETLTPGLTLSWVDRGADALAQVGTISTDFAEALKAEGKRRAESGNFFGYMAYASLTGQKTT